MKQYEYAIMHIDISESELNKMGSQGWRLINVVEKVTNSTVIFEREK